jgi:hypothetical protein
MLVAMGQTMPAAAPAPQSLVRVWVYTAVDTPETAEERARQDSVKDLRAALADKKRLVAADPEETAPVKIEVVSRTTTIPKFAFGLGGRAGQSPGVPASAGPTRDVHLRVTLTWGGGAVAFTNTNTVAESAGGWRAAANDVAKQIDKWITDHAAEISKRS